MDQNNSKFGNSEKPGGFGQELTDLVNGARCLLRQHFRLDRSIARGHPYSLLVLKRRQCSSSSLAKHEHGNRKRAFAFSFRQQFYMDISQVAGD
jgi:hypothetical protein